MKKNRLPVLIALVAVFGGAGVAILKSRAPETEVVALNQPLIEGLKDDLNKVSRLKLIGPENKLIAELERTDKGWVAANKGGYPADVAKVREFLLKLADSRLREEKTANKERYVALGVEDLAGKDAKGVGVEIEGLAKPVKLVIGSFSSGGGQGHYVRIGEQAQSYLASGAIRPETAEGQWLQADIANIGSPRVRRVDISPPTGTRVSIEKTDPNAPDYTVLDVPKGRELSSPSVGNGISSLMDSLRFDDVLKADQAQPDPAALYKARFLTHEGVVVEIEGWERDSKAHLRLKASLDSGQNESWLLGEEAKARAEAQALADRQASQSAPAPTSSSSSSAPAADAAAAESSASAAAASSSASSAPAAPAFDAAKFREEKLATLNKEVAEINQRADGWTFVVASWKFANIKKTMDDLLKPKEK